MDLRKEKLGFVSRRSQKTWRSAREAAPNTTGIRTAYLSRSTEQRHKSADMALKAWQQETGASDGLALLGQAFEMVSLVQVGGEIEVLNDESVAFVSDEGHSKGLELGGELRGDREPEWADNVSDRGEYFFGDDFHIDRVNRIG